MNEKESIIAAAYTSYNKMLQHYVSKRINDSEEAFDIVQDVFIRMLSYDLVTEATIKNLCFAVANNLVIDHIRRHYKRQEVYGAAYETMKRQEALTPEQIATFHDLAEKERCLMLQLSPSTSHVYEMSQMEGMTIDEIAQKLNISRRTVECHQFKGRKIVRERMRAII